MLHLNEELDLFLPALSWVNRFIPELYTPVSVNDFVENRHLVKPTKTILPLGVFFYGDALIGFRNVSFRRGAEDTHTLYDMTDEMEIEISPGALETVTTHHLTHTELTLPDGRLFKADVLYHPQTDKAYLFAVTRSGRPARKTERAELTDRLETQRVYR